MKRSQKSDGTTTCVVQPEEHVQRRQSQILLGGAKGSNKGPRRQVGRFISKTFFTRCSGEVMVAPSSRLFITWLDKG